MVVTVLSALLTHLILKESHKVDATTTPILQIGNLKHKGVT